MMATDVLLGFICGAFIAITVALFRIADVLEEIKKGDKE